jgi:hypothetical protein
MIKSIRIRWTGYVECMEEMRNAKFWLENLKEEWERLLGTS